MTAATLMNLAPLLIVLVGGLVVMLMDAFLEEKAEPALISALFLGTAAAVSMKLAMAGGANGLPSTVSAYLSNDGLALLVDVSVLVGAALASLLAGGYFDEHGDQRGEFYVLVIFSSLGAMVLGRANDLLSVFVGLETMSLGAYSLVGFRRTSPRAAEGALKYFLLGSFAAALFLFGAALLYGATGSTSFVGIRESIAGGHADTALLAFAMLLLVAGLAFKVSAVPFHMWTPDAYEGAATPATTFMAVVVKAAAFAVIVRFFLVALGDEASMDASSGWPPLLAALAALTLVFGNLGALAQSSVKRMLAYSSIAHAGFVLTGIAAAFKVGEQAVSSVAFYLLAYTVSNVLAFGSLIAVGSHGKEAVSYEDLAGVGRRHPLVAVPFVLGILSLMGFPPTAGFFAKYYVLSAAVSAGGFMLALAILGVLASAVGAYYYLRVLVYLFMREPQAGAPVAVPMRSEYVSVALALAATGVLLLGIAPGLVLEPAIEAAKSLLLGS